MQPAVLVDHLLGGARVVPVAREGHGALDQDLAVGGDPDRAAGIGRPTVPIFCGSVVLELVAGLVLVMP